MLAIDFGTSRIKVAYLQNGEAKLAAIGRGNLPYIPALFYIDKDGEVLVGDDAQDMLNFDPKGVVETLKRKLRELTIRKNRQKISPKKLVEILFQQIRDRCHQELPHIFPQAPTDVVLTYPARYTEVEKQIIRKAAMMVGFENVYTVTEPEAAALAWQYKGGSSLSSDVVVILDCGGGTADWACLKLLDGKLRLFSELPPGGDESLGGHDIESELIQLIKGDLKEERNEKALSILHERDQEILFQLQCIKERYSKRGRLSAPLRTVRLGTTKIELSEEDLQEIFDARIINNLVTNFSEYLRQVKSKTGTEKPVVLLVGGTGQLKGLKEAIQDQCGVEVVWWMESEFATVQGALYCIETEENNQSKEEETISPGIRRENWTGSMKLFDALDTDGDGILSQVELMQLIQLNQKEDARKAEEKRLAQEALQRQEEAKRLEEKKRLSLLFEAADLQEKAKSLNISLSPLPNSSQDILSWMTQAAVQISQEMNKQQPRKQKEEAKRLEEKKIVAEKKQEFVKASKDINRPEKKQKKDNINKAMEKWMKLNNYLNR